MTISNDDLFQLMDTASSMRDALEQKMTKIRACKRECAYRKYYYDKQHREMIEQAIQTPAGFGDWGADLCTMQVEKGMEISIYKAKQKKPSNKPKQSAYIRCLEKKIEAEKARR